jgi:hypothetical protein
MGFSPCIYPTNFISNGKKRQGTTLQLAEKVPIATKRNDGL